MLREGDRVLVCLSGGKDSLSLLHTIRQYQFYCKAKVWGVQISFKQQLYILGLLTLRKCLLYAV